MGRLKRRAQDLTLSHGRFHIPVCEKTIMRANRMGHTNRVLHLAHKKRRAIRFRLLILAGDDLLQQLGAKLVGDSPNLVTHLMDTINLENGYTADLGVVEVN